MNRNIADAINIIGKFCGLRDIEQLNRSALLEKYGFEVISLDDTNESVSDKVIKDVTNLIKNGSVKHIFVLEHTENNDIVKDLIESTNVETYTYRRLDSITDSEREEDKNYITLMTENIDLLKNELY